MTNTGSPGRRAAKRTAAVGEREYRLLAENATDMISRHALDGTCLWASPSAKSLYGYEPEELVGRKGESLFHPEDWGAVIEAHRRTVATSEPVRILIRLRRKDGAFAWVETISRALRDEQTGRPLEIHCSTRDVGERRQLEEQLLRSQKMEALGRLASGVAHDFNNLLTVVHGYAHVIQVAPDVETARRHAGAIAEAAGRASALTRQLLAFGRAQLLAPRPVDLGAIVHDLERMLGRVIGEDVALEVDVPHEPATVEVDPAQIGQVVMNLAVNAREAMPRGGRLSISVAPLEGGERDWVSLTVADTGAGIPAEALEHVFEPFFTTKADSGGSGLGLATVYGIVEQSGGRIELDSEPGRGTVVRVLLPRAAAPAREGGAAVQSRAAAELHGSETILLVEDDGLVLDLVEQVLSGYGYGVLQAASPGEAAALADGSPERIDLLVTDVVMPGTTGVALAHEIERLRPGTRALFLTGYPDHADLAGLPPEALLEKPFTPEDLAAKVRGLLDAPR